jgi:hypothetical protein
VGAALLSLALTPSAFAASPAKLAPISIGFSSASVTPGSSLAIGGKIANTGGKSGKAKFSIALTGSGKTTSLVSKSFSVGAHNKAPYHVTATIPASLADGSYAVEVCVAKKCVTAKSKLTVLTPVPASAPSTSAPGDVPTGAPAPADTPLVPTVPAPGGDATPDTGSTVPEEPTTPVEYTPGAQSIGDDLFPWLGNGGYDATHYDVALGYTPEAQFLNGRTTVTATATQDLSQFSLDFQGFHISSLTVNGAPATFERIRPDGYDTIDLEDYGEVSKLVITPASGIRSGSTFVVVVTYSGIPETVIDPDESIEGFIKTDTGAVVVNEPMGAMGWFPNNNTPIDKATFDLHAAVPAGKEVLGNGELVSKTTLDGLTTFNWRETHPMATYLSTATIGDYEIHESATADGIPLYDGIDLAVNTNPDTGATIAAITDAQKTSVINSLVKQGPTVDYLSSIFGPYPFGSAGAIIANAGYIGYALEVQSKPIYTGKSAGALTHELIHQWFGDSVSVKYWRDLWLAEGFATWGTWYYNNQQGSSTTTTAQQFASSYAQSETTSSGALRAIWMPAVAQTAPDIFGTAVYNRGALLIEALRQIVGDDVFWDILHDWQSEYRYSSRTSQDFEDLAERDSGLDLSAFFQDWLYKVGKPTITPAVFAAGKAGKTVAAAEAPVVSDQPLPRPEDTREHE